MSQHPCGQLLFHLQMGRLRLREIKKPAPGHMVGEQLSINSSSSQISGSVFSATSGTLSQG